MKEKELRPIVCDWLRQRGLFVIPNEVLFWSMCDVVAVRFAEQTSRCIPALELLVAVELKLTRVAEVITQARHHRWHAHESWAAMPTETVKKMRRQTLARFREAGVGLLAVGSHACWEVQGLGPCVAAEVNLERQRKKLWAYVRKPAEPARRVHKPCEPPPGPATA